MPEKASINPWTLEFRDKKLRSEYCEQRFDAAVMKTMLNLLFIIGPSYFSAKFLVLGDASVTVILFLVLTYFAATVAAYKAVNEIPVISKQQSLYFASRIGVCHVLAAMGGVVFILLESFVLCTSENLSNNCQLLQKNVIPWDWALHTIIILICGPFGNVSFRSSLLAFCINTVGTEIAIYNQFGNSEFDSARYHTFTSRLMYVPAMFIMPICFLYQTHNLSLQTFLAQRTLKLERIVRVQERAADRSRALMEYIGSVAHDLRAPLQAFESCSEILFEESKDTETYSALKAANTFMKHLVSNVMHQTIIATNLEENNAAPKSSLITPYFEQVSLSELTKEVEALMNMYTHGRPSVQWTYYITPGVPDLIHTDKMWLSSMLVNYLTNAKKFTEKGRVELLIDYVNGNILVEVKDTGPGVPLELRDQLFRPFTQLKLEKTGTGLGLCSVSTKAAILGGKSGYRPRRRGMGSVFWFEIPPRLNKTEKKTRFSAQKSTGFKKFVKNAFSKTILIVDDDPIVRILLSKQLQKIGIVTHTANNGIEALEMLEKREIPYLAILSDLNMPLLNGIEFVKQYRALEKTKAYRTSLIGLSGNVSYQNEALKNGFDAFASKPIDSNYLKAILMDTASVNYSDRVRRKSTQAD